MTDKLNIDDLKRRMDGAISSFGHDLAGLRTGRASSSMIDHIMIDAYGSKTPLEQVGTISVPEPRTISVQVWDKGLVISVEKAIQEAGLGLNPQSDGQLLRIPVPELNEERREELIKIAGKYAEQSKVSVRNIRRDLIENVRKLQKKGDISEDQKHGDEIKIQEITDKIINTIDSILLNKENEILEK